MDRITELLMMEQVYFIHGMVLPLIQISKHELPFWWLWAGTVLG